ncbi:MAG TPA: ABC transporter permease [Actinomycetota bacterium]|nr:ABC transporter permease [Actinomycetota bacterium]
MNPRRVLAIALKDLKDVVRDVRILPLILATLIPALLFRADQTPVASVAYAAADETKLPDTLRQATRGIKLKFVKAEDASEVKSLVRRDKAVVGFATGAGFDAQLAAGQAPELVIVTREDSGFRASALVTALDATVRALAGQRPAATIRPEVIPSKETGPDRIFRELGVETFMRVAFTILLVLMVALSIVPTSVTEESERKTLDALLLAAARREVIAAKAMVGLVLTAVGVPVLAAVSGLKPAQPFAYFATCALLAVSMVGVGLLVGGLMKSQAALNAWSPFLVLPLSGTAFAAAFDLPALVRPVIQALPTSHAMRLASNFASGKQVFGGQALSLAVLAVWAVGAYVVLGLRLRTRET